MPAKNNIMWQVKVNQNTSYAFNIVIFYSTSAVAVTLRLCVAILHSRGRLTSHTFSLPNTRWVWSKSDERAITVLSVTPPMMSMSQHKRFWWRCLIALGSQEHKKKFLFKWHKVWNTRGNRCPTLWFQIEDFFPSHVKWRNGKCFCLVCGVQRQLENRFMFLWPLNSSTGEWYTISVKYACSLRGMWAASLQMKLRSGPHSHALPHIWHLSIMYSKFRYLDFNFQ